MLSIEYIQAMNTDKPLMIDIVDHSKLRWGAVVSYGKPWTDMTDLWPPADEKSRHAWSRKRTVSFIEATSSEELHAAQTVAAYTKLMVFCYLVQPNRLMMSYKLFVCLLVTLN